MSNNIKLQALQPDNGVGVEFEFSTKNGNFDKVVGTAVEEVLRWHTAMRNAGVKGFNAKSPIHFKIERNGIELLDTVTMCKVDAVRRLYVPLKIMNSPKHRMRFRNRMSIVLAYAFGDIKEGTLTEHLLAEKAMFESAQQKAAKALPKGEVAKA